VTLYSFKNLAKLTISQNSSLEGINEAKNPAEESGDNLELRAAIQLKILITINRAIKIFNRE